MRFLQRLWRYLTTGARMRAEAAMDPEIELEQAIAEARRRDQHLRNQAAKVLAHRTMLERDIESTAEEVAEARELAKQALLRADEAARSGDTAAVERWNRSAQSLALRLQAVESNLESLKRQYEFAVTQAEEAKVAVQQNAMRLQEMAAQRLRLLGSLQQARMQESVNSAVESMTQTLGDTGPSLDQVEQKVNRRLSEAEARAELRAATPEGAEAELREAISLSKADAKLAELRSELGLGAPQPLTAPGESDIQTEAERRQRSA